MTFVNLLERKEKMQTSASPRGHRSQAALSLAHSALFAALSLGLAACGETAKTTPPPSVNEVHTYFSGPFNFGGRVGGQGYAVDSVAFDDAANQINVKGGSTVPALVISGTFTTTPTGFLDITETFAASMALDCANFSPGVNCPLTGGWAVEIPGTGALADLLNINTGTSDMNGLPIIQKGAGPAAMVENTACPNFPEPVTFLYVTVPAAGVSTSSADYGTVGISNQGSAVTFKSTPFVIGQPAVTPFAVTGGCSVTAFGAITAYPLNSIPGQTPDRIAISTSGLLIDSSSSNSGAFGQNVASTGVIGVAVPAAPVDVSAVIGAKYNGFIYAPGDIPGSFNNGTGNDDDGNPVQYDTTFLASAFGDNTAASDACKTPLLSSITANLQSEGGMIAASPSPNSLFGGEFKNGNASAVNGSERCDVVVDLGQQDPMNNGLFPNATIFIGQNYPPATDTSATVCLFAFTTNAPCAFAFPAAAIVGTEQGQFVIFVATDAASTPPAQLPTDVNGTPVNTPVGIYLIQKTE